ncbi:hypothetical protein JTB14_009844 [Gonioctena quinquepunctata]|nr:hypothetical protein JTB14_009844 [Gonioctena quinquepunctata]
MRSLKVQGRLTHGRGVQEGIQTRWTKSFTAGQHVCEQIENYCGVSFETSHQHHGLSSARSIRDDKDCAGMIRIVPKLWLQEHFPFPESSNLFSLSTGIVADERIDCHEAWEKGMRGIGRCVENFNFGGVKFQRIDRVQPLAIMNNGIKIGDDIIPVNPTTLFQRISVAKNCDEQLEFFLSYDLGAYSFSLFENGLRKETKSALYKAFVPTQNKLFSEKVQYVIDAKLHSQRMTWRQATEDADTVIVNEALPLAEGTETVVVVGEDIDLLVILTGLCQRENVLFLKPGKGNVPPTTYSPVHALQNKFIKEHIMFLHSMNLTNPPEDGSFDVEIQDELGFTLSPVVETIEESVDKEDEDLPPPEKIRRIDEWTEEDVTVP